MRRSMVVIVAPHPMDGGFMLLWALMNVLLPLLPIVLIAFLSWALQWQKSVIDILSDGQLYFFSTSVCGVFAFDALRYGKLEPSYFAVTFLVEIALVAFYTASCFVAHSGSSASTPAAVNSVSTNRKLAWVSIIVTVSTTSAICYLRSSLGLL